MERRDCLKKVGAIGISSAILSGTASAQGTGSKPNGNVTTEKVSIFASEDDPNQVSSGNWLKHEFGWLAGSEEAVEHWLDAVELSISIDGQEVEDIDQYWGDIVRYDDDGNWVVWWTYYTPPKSPGIHTFSVDFSYPNGLDPDYGDLEPGTNYTFTGFYEVVTENGN